mgnify:CR=1 FL=1
MVNDKIKIHYLISWSTPRRRLSIYLSIYLSIRRRIDPLQRGTQHYFPLPNRDKVASRGECALPPAAMLAMLLLAHAATAQLGATAAAGAECGGDPFCGGNGQCWQGVCRCSRGFSGAACSTLVGCPNECMGQGTCARAGLDGAQRACRCLSGWSGLACDSQRCPDDCSGRGRCVPPGITRAFSPSSEPRARTSSPGS